MLCSREVRGSGAPGLPPNTLPYPGGPGGLCLCPRPIPTTLESLPLVSPTHKPLPVLPPTHSHDPRVPPPLSPTHSHDPRVPPPPVPDPLHDSRVPPFPVPSPGSGRGRPVSQLLPELNGRDPRWLEAGCGVHRAGGKPRRSEGKDLIGLGLRRRDSPESGGKDPRLVRPAFPGPGPSQFPQRRLLPGPRRNHG